jgi:5-methylcytosine-specific restriction endonuclease McrA
MTKFRPLSYAGFCLVEDIVRNSSNTVRSAQELVTFALEVAQQIDLLEDQRDREWDAWYKEQYRITERNQAAVKAAQTNCVYCNKVLDDTSHTDHIRPVKSGGSGEIINLVEACAGCNLEKNGKDFWTFLETKLKKERHAIIRRLDRLGKQIPLQPVEPTEAKK